MTKNSLYYSIAAKGSRELDNHPGLQYLKQLAEKSKNVLDVGCGEGSRLNILLDQHQQGTGIDINKFAIKKAAKQYPRHQFIHHSPSKLPFKDSSFDLVYSAFVLEHTINPQALVNEMIRLTSNKGRLVILCPNFGAPNRRSPNSNQNPYQKFSQGIKNDLALLVNKPGLTLNWRQVTPKKSYLNLDDDTTTEPYLFSLIKYLQAKKLDILQSLSLWNLEPLSFSPRKLILSLFGKLNLFPFKYWGPQIFIAAQKLN